MGKLPFNLLWEIPTTSNSCWSKRNLGKLPVSMLRLQLDSTRTFNWNKGSQLWFSVSISSLLLSLKNWITLSLEWLANKLNENKPSKRLWLKSMYSRDVRLAIGDEDKLPLNQLSDISKYERDVKLFRHGGSIPSKPLLASSIPSSFFSAQNSIKNNKRLAVSILNLCHRKNQQHNLINIWNHAIASIRFEA